MSNIWIQHVDSKAAELHRVVQRMHPKRELQIEIGICCEDMLSVREKLNVDRSSSPAMNIECYPITVLPHITPLFRDYLDTSESGAGSRLRRYYPAAPFDSAWAASSVTRADDRRTKIADLLEAQNRLFGASAAAMENIAKLRAGAGAVVTGQQVALFGGPLLTLLKAATAVRKAQDATAAGHPHVPVFWLATEDHDLAEVNHVALPGKNTVETLRLHIAGHGATVGGLRLGDGILPLLEQAKELLGYAPVCDLLTECYTPEATLGGAFARFIAKVFAAEGLIVIEASAREFHALGAGTLRYAIEHAEELHAALDVRNAELAADGYHAQVLVQESGSLLFLLDEKTGARTPLKHLCDGEWKCAGQSYTTAELLVILQAQPERISPNALLRPVFQDTLLPTSAYIGGPSEIAYFAQSQVLYQAILGRTTPVLPRFSATLIEPSLAKMMAGHELALPDVMTMPDALAQKLGARAMPVESKRKLAAAGHALDTELTALTAWMHAMDASLGVSADVAASKMRYQMNRLRRMAAAFELQKEASLRKHADALTLHLFPQQTPQERLTGGVWFLARYGEELPALLVQHADQGCPGHRAMFL